MYEEVIRVYYNNKDHDKYYIYDQHTTFNLSFLGQESLPKKIKSFDLNFHCQSE